MSQTKLKIIRFLVKISLKFGKGLFLSSRFVQISRKIADKALENSLANDEITKIQESGEIKEIEVQKLLKLKGIASSANLFCFKSLP